MRIAKRLSSVVSVSAFMAMVPSGAGYAQPDPFCEADYWGGPPNGCTPNGVIDFTDIIDELNCVRNGFERCGRDPLVVCDLDNNGAVDYCDFGYALELFAGVPVPQACQEPCWACCSQDEPPECVETTEAACPSIYAGGVYQGDGVPCTALPCTCYADYWGGGGDSCEPDWVVSFTDIFDLSNCVRNGFERCGRDPLTVCDVDQNGVVDYCDLGYAIELFLGVPAQQACQEPCWACCSQDAPPACVETTEAACPNVYAGGVYEGDGVPCAELPCMCYADYWGGGPDGCEPDGVI